MSTQVNASNSTGKKEPISRTGTDGDVMQPVQPKVDTEVPSKPLASTSQEESDSSSLTLEQFLPIFQEDLHLLKDLGKPIGVDFRIIPDGVHPFDCVIALKGIRLKNGDFIPKATAGD